jgi:ParB-like chromosome segregation protein Spo0J
MGRFNTDRLESKVNNIKTANEQFEKININDIIDCSDNHFPLTEIEELAYDIAERGLDDNLVVGRCNKEVAEHYGVKEGQYLLISGHRRKTAIMYANEHIDKFNMQEIMCKIKPFNSVANAKYQLNMANLQSRRLTSSDLMRAFTELKNLLPDLEKEGMKISGRTRDFIAKTLNISSAQVGKMENVYNNAVDEVKTEVEQGTLSINAANVIARLDDNEQKDIINNYSETDRYDEAKKRVEEIRARKEAETTAEPDEPIEEEPDNVPNATPNITVATRNDVEKTVTVEKNTETENSMIWDNELVLKSVDYVFNKFSLNVSEETKNQLKGIEMMLKSMLKKTAEQAREFIGE